MILKQHLLIRLFLLIFVGSQTANLAMVSAQVNPVPAARKNNKITKDDPNLLRQQAFKFLQSGNWLEANNTFDLILKQLPNDHVSLYGKGLALFNLRKIDEADTILQKAIDTLSNKNANDAILADSLVLSAVISATRKQVSKAIEKLLKAVSIAPQNFDANLSLGRAYFGNGDLVNAVKFFRQATLIQPKNLQARFFLATALERNGNLQEALKEYRETVKLNNDYAEGNLGLGVLLINLDGIRSEEGLNALKKAVSLKGDMYEARLTLGRTLVKLNRSAEAIEHLKKAVEIAPNNPEPHYQLALAYRKIGKKDEAAQELQFVKKIHEARRKVSSN